jgi:hypothetical protein
VANRTREEEQVPALASLQWIPRRGERWLAGGWQAFNPENERKMAKRANAKTTEVNSSHAAYISHPKETAKLIEEAASSAPQK